MTNAEALDALRDGPKTNRELAAIFFTDDAEVTQKMRSLIHRGLVRRTLHRGEARRTCYAVYYLIDDLAEIEAMRRQFRETCAVGYSLSSWDEEPEFRAPTIGLAKAGDYWFRQGILIKSMTKAHYDHHYGPGAFDQITNRAQRRLGYRMLAALALLPIPQ